MSGERGAINVSYVMFNSQNKTAIVDPNEIQLFTDSGNNLSVHDHAGDTVKIVDQPTLSVGNPPTLLIDSFLNNSGSTIPNYAAVRLIQGGAQDGTLALSDADEINEDTFLGLVYGGAIGNGVVGGVIYSGKVPNAVAGLGLPSMTKIYMSNIPGEWTSTIPDFFTNTVFQIGFTRGDDIYLRPVLKSAL